MHPWVCLSLSPLTQRTRHPTTHHTISTRKETEREKGEAYEIYLQNRLHRTRHFLNALLVGHG